MQKGVKFRIYPNTEQKNLIQKTLGCCRQKIIDNVTEFMWCNFGICHMEKCSWKNLREVRNYIKTEGMDKIKDI